MRSPHHCHHMTCPKSIVQLPWIFKRGPSNDSIVLLPPFKSLSLLERFEAVLILILKLIVIAIIKSSMQLLLFFFLSQVNITSSQLERPT